MSHWVKVQTKMQDLDNICAALDRMGQKYQRAEEGKSLTVSAEGQNAEVQVIINDKKGRNDVGIKQQADGTFAFVGDFYYTGLNQSKFKEDLQGQYAVVETVDNLENLGFFVDNEDDLQAGEDRLIRFTASNPHI